MSSMKRLSDIRWRVVQGGNFAKPWVVSTEEGSHFKNLRENLILQKGSIDTEKQKMTQVIDSKNSIWKRKLNWRWMGEKRKEGMWEEREGGGVWLNFLQFFFFSSLDPSFTLPMIKSATSWLLPGRLNRGRAMQKSASMQSFFLGLSRKLSNFSKGMEVIWFKERRISISNRLRTFDW